MVSSEELIKIADESSSISEIIIKLRLASVGSSYDNVRKALKEANYNLEDLSNRAQAKIRSCLTNNIPRPINEFSSRGSIKKFLIRNGVEYKCAICNINTWQETKLALQLDHINGDRFNNNQSNLRFLCPNCHSQTDTFAGKNKQKKETECGKKYLTQCICGESKSRRSKLCRACNNKKPRIRDTKIEWPSKEYILKELEDISMCKLAKKLGVSDNAIRKHLRNH